MTGPGIQGAAEIAGEVARISFRNDENGWTVLKFKHEKMHDAVTVTGHFAQIHPGESLQLFGAWVSHPQYGKQFKADRAVPLRPSSQAAIERYLSSGIVKGLGEKTAKRILEKFGDKTLHVLDNTPELLFGVKGIAKKKLQDIINAWNETKKRRDIDLFLNLHGFTPNQVNKICKMYGEQVIETVSRNPYQLASDIYGIGFVTADKIAARLDIASDSTMRIEAGALHCLQLAEDRGHCFLTTQQLLQELGQLLELSLDVVAPKLAGILSDLNDAGKLISDKRTNPEGTWVAHYRSELFIAESMLSETLVQLNRGAVTIDSTRVEQWLDKYAAQLQTPLSKTQRQAAVSAAQDRVFILTGGPGVGKTTTANAIIRLFKAMGKSVALAAPTGRAAQRLSEVSAMEAKTIHRLLEWSPQTGGFTRDRSNPIPQNVVIIDEASMLDIKLAHALVDAVPMDGHLIFIGDVDQLPSVGPGNVLRDMIESNVVPCCRLQEIFRQAATSHIVRTAHAINQGQPPSFSDDITSDCRFVQADTPAELREQLLLRASGKNALNLFDPIKDVQILTPMNRGDFGTVQLNIDLQALLNPQDPAKRELQRGGTNFREGDKVIQTSNNYDLGVFNGDIGYIENIKPTGKGLTVAFADKKAEYDMETLGELKLAYAITIHKSQGSEFPVVLIPVTTQHHIMLQRNLIYTAVTRARKLALFIGSQKALRYAVHQQESRKRQTLLMQRLQEFEAQGPGHNA